MDEQYRTNTTNTAEQPPPGHPTLPRALANNLRCGARLALFRRADPERFTTAPVDLALLSVTDLAVNLVLSFLLVGTAGSLGYTALPAFFFYLPLMLLCGLLTGKLLARPDLVILLPAALIALSIPLEILHGGFEGVALLSRTERLSGLLDSPSFFRFFPWWTAAASLFLMRLGPAPLLRRLAALVLFLVLVVLPLWYFPRGDLWVGESGRNGEELHLTEEVLAAQQRLLDEQLDTLLPGRNGVADLYFVGFAGDASQDVFMRELTAVARLFIGRFGTAGRTVTLVNSPQTATTQPFATATNLARALNRVGRVMDREEDVLFLFLTSHGSADHQLAVNNGALELDEITPEMIRRMLADSGIRWKVIVVSACHAGGFIPPLQDDHTLIVTAADASHESFGCENGKDYTWFGRAYFDEALRGTFSFATAFERARETIRRREKEERETPSNPQIWMGEAIRQKLSLLEERLAVRK